MNQKKIYFATLLIVLNLGFNNTVFAQGCDPDAHQQSDYWTMLESMHAGGCFQSSKNTSAVAKSVQQALDDSSQKKFQRASEALNILRQELLLNSDTNSTALSTAIEKLKNDINNNPEAPPSGLKDEWKLGIRLDRLPDALEDLDLQSGLDEEQCGQVASGQCTAEFEAATSILRSIELANAAIDKYSEKYRQESYADRSLRRAKWDSYYDDLTFQYPWELLVNNWVLEHYDSRAGLDGNKKGFRELPRSKLVVLHPEANLVYADNAQDEYEITLTMEVLGYESFDFNAKGKVDNAIGVSLLAAYMDQANRAESGWTAGLLFKYHGYSMGVTDNHGDTGIVFNVNLSQKIFDVKEESRKYYDDFQQKIDYMGKLVEEGQQKLEDAKKYYRISE